ncbi:MAG: hypothetical protein P4L40_04580 [Terracidiphilus sp.]|nr:hypothetical protein [Terracidiphilus sp.]
MCVCVCVCCVCARLFQALLVSVRLVFLVSVMPPPLLPSAVGSMHPEDLWRKRALDDMTSPSQGPTRRARAAPSPEEVLEEEEASDDE